MPTCFVIMPFGEKKDPDGKAIDFDAIYKDIIKAGVESLRGMECVRCDEIDEAGVVQKQMLESIHQADAVVVDITTSNPNVFYELGVRHALADCVTVIIKREGTGIPFNIRSMKAIEYNPESPESVEKTRKKIAAYISNGLESRTVDSLVHSSLQIRIVEQPVPIQETKIHRYRLKSGDRRIGLVTGDLQNVKGIDAWVSSENTNMEMSRFYERSISGVIRYLGARKKAGRVVDDSVARLLRDEVGETAEVPAGTVIVTGAGELERTHNVKRILHAAAVSGQIGQGYRPIADVTRCIRNVFTEISSADHKDAGIRSILFPLLGTGQAGAKADDLVHLLIKAAVACLEGDDTTPVREAYFLCWTRKDLEYCRSALKRIGLKPVG